MSTELRVDWIACEAHGMCAELLPERIALDEWGYPLLDGEPIPPELEDHARRAAEACPTFALKLEQIAVTAERARPRPQRVNARSPERLSARRR
jgi:ferredoxin